MSRLRSIAETILHFSILATFFFVPWWLRPGWPWLPTPNYGGFFVSVPVLLAVGSWFILGVPGLHESLKDDRRWWVMGIFALMVWCFLSSLWSIYPANAADSAQQFAAVGLFSITVVCQGPSARGVCRALALGMLFQAAIALAQVQLQRPIGLPQLGEFTLRPYNVGLSILVSGTSRLLRPYGLTNHPNVLGGYFAFGLLSLTGWLAPTGPTRRWLRALQIAVGVLALWILCLSFSRSA